MQALLSDLAAAGSSPRRTRGTRFDPAMLCALSTQMATSAFWSLRLSIKSGTFVILDVIVSVVKSVVRVVIVSTLVRVTREVLPHVSTYSPDNPTWAFCNVRVGRYSVKRLCGRRDWNEASTEGLRFEGESPHSQIPGIFSAEAAHHWIWEEPKEKQRSE